MNLTSPSQVKAWCIDHGFHPNKVLGQNFLVDRNALEAIVDAAALPPGARVLEIGPGLGVLTEEMLRRGYAVTAIEKDPVLAERLAEALGNPPNLVVRAGDALDLIKEGACDGFPALVSNLPYQAGTRILLELTQRMGGTRSCASESGASAAPETAVVLVQTEVAERLAAGPGSKARGLAGVWVQLRARADGSRRTTRGRPRLQGARSRGRVGAARLRRTARACRQGLLLLAASGGGLHRGAPHAPPPQRRACARLARSFPPNHETGL